MEEVAWSQEKRKKQCLSRQGSQDGRPKNHRGKGQVETAVTGSEDRTGSGLTNSEWLQEPV